MEQIRYAAASGVICPGEAPPSIRPLAEEPRVNRNAIAKAYAELANQGVIKSLSGKGCFLKTSNTPFTSKVRQQLLVLDEPTSGIDPVVRREFIETVIGAYQSGVPKRRTAFFSTHLISEFECLIHEFTVIEARRNVCTVEADAARDRFQMIPARNSSATFTTPRPGEGRGEGPPETTLLHHTRISGNTQRR